MGFEWRSKQNPNKLLWESTSMERRNFNRQNTLDMTIYATMESCITLDSGCKAKLWRSAQSIGWFSNRTGTSFDDGVRKGLNSTSGAQFVALPLVKPAVWFARTDVNWRSRSVAKSASYSAKPEEESKRVLKPILWSKYHHQVLLSTKMTNVTRLWALSPPQRLPLGTQ